MGNLERLLMDPPRRPDVRPTGCHVICGMCNSYPANWQAHQWRCPTVQDTRAAKDDACERWTPREEWKPDPPMYSSITERRERADMDAWSAPVLPDPDLPLPPIAPRDGYVYFIQCGEFVKIGFSQDPRSRKSSLETSMPYKLEFIGLMVGSIATERKLHREHKVRRHNGEWFRLDDELRAEIARLCGPKWKHHLKRR